MPGRQKRNSAATFGVFLVDSHLAAVQAPAAAAPATAGRDDGGVGRGRQEGMFYFFSSFMRAQAPLFSHRILISAWVCFQAGV